MDTDLPTIFKYKIYPLSLFNFEMLFPVSNTRASLFNNLIVDFIAMNLFILSIAGVSSS